MFPEGKPGQVTVEQSKRFLDVFTRQETASLRPHKGLSIPRKRREGVDLSDWMIDALYIREGVENSSDIDFWKD